MPLERVGQNHWFFSFVSIVSGLVFSSFFFLAHRFFQPFEGFLTVLNGLLPFCFIMSLLAAPPFFSLIVSKIHGLDKSEMRSVLIRTVALTFVMDFLLMVVAWASITLH
jgi:hypothetical protein